MRIVVFDMEWRCVYTCGRVCLLGHVTDPSLDPHKQQSGTEGGNPMWSRGPRKEGWPRCTAQECRMLDITSPSPSRLREDVQENLERTK